MIKSGRIAVICMVLLSSIAIFGAPVDAAGTPAKIIAFTDKKEYMAWWMDAKTTTPGFNKLNDEGQYIFIYAVVLDDDGNIMKNRNIQVTMNDTVFDHWDKGNWNVHNAIVSNNTYFKTAQNLNDTGTFNDSIASDGLYTSMISMNSTLLADVQTTTTPYKVDNQIRVKLVVRDLSSGLNTTAYVLVTGGKCHQSGTTNHPAHITSSASDLCTDCHQGYEHFFENISGTIPDDYLDIHFKKNGLLPDSTEVVKGMQDYNWNSTQFDGLAPYGSSASWRSRSGGGALYCRFCHKDPSGSNWFDYGGGGRSDLNDRPSCAQNNCHTATEIEGTAIIPWSQGGAVTGNDTLKNINNQKSHNHTTTPAANVSCTICHAIPHGQTMPNMSANISAGGNINAQCWYCHNISGGLNITSNGGSEIPHSNTDCKACHYDGSGKLDSHQVPAGKSGGVNCTSCHNIGGSAGYDVNFTAINMSMHATLNSGATSTPQTTPNKPCWACHGTLNGMYANESDQPASEHNATYYRDPRKCQDCHTTGIFNAKNVTDHIPSGYNAATDVNTSSYNNTYCSYCHNNSVNNGNDSFMGLSTGGSPMNASTSHYGANRTAGKLMSATNNSTDCVYCHRNSSNMAKWGILAQTPANLSNKNGSAGTGTNHNPYTASSQCSACHGSYTVTAVFTFHNSSTGSGSSGGADCKLCHDVGGSAGAGKLVNFTAMNDSSAIHKNLNTGASASVNSENRKCWACHGNGSQPGSAHPANYQNPYNCTNCHVPGAGQNFNYTPNNTLLNVSRHYWNGTSIVTPAATTCYLCHNRSEMMLGTDLDPDGAGTLYGSLNGGNNSTSHYGKNRTDLRSWNSGGAVNCSYCHQNSSTAFSNAMTDPSYNRSIQNHTQDNSPTCINSTCHDSGWMHNSTLRKPSLILPNSTYCQNCHLARQKHNGTQDCTKCHIDQGSNDTIHPVKYLLASGSFDTTSSQAVACSDCHQNIFSGFSSAPIIPVILKHSSSASNGTIWGAYWGAAVASSQNNTSVSEEAVTTGTTSGISAAQAADGSFETMTEADTGSAPVDQYTYVSNNTTAIGTIANWANMQGASDGAYATLTEAGTGGGAGGNTSYHATSSPTGHTSVTGTPDNTLSSTNNGYINGSGFAAGGSGTITKVVLKYYYSITSYGAGDIPSLGYALNGLGTVSKTDTGNVAYSYPNPTYTVDITSALGTWTWADIQSLTLWNRVAKTGGASTTANVDAFEVNVTTSGGTTTYSMNITTDTSSVPSANNHYLEINYSKTAADDYDVYVFNGSAWNDRGTLNSEAWTVYNYTLTGAEYNSGNPKVRYIDQNSSGTTQGNLYIDYQRIHSVSSGSSNYRLDLQQNVTGIPEKDYHYLTVKGKTDNGEPYDVRIYDSSSGWVTKATIAGDTSEWYNTSLSATQISGGKVQVRYVDTNISSDTVQNTLSLDYAGVRSENLTMGNSSCYYCHGNTKHNATALGIVSTLLTDPNNTRGGLLATTTYCADCHYNSSENAYYYGSIWYPVPPLITVDNTGKGSWMNHSAYLDSGYKDEDCRACHELNGSYLQTSLNYSHSLDPGAGGGPNCIICHNLVTGLSGGAPVGINFTAANASSHNGTNSNNATQRGFAPIVGACWACHDSDGNVTSGHPDRYKNPKTCTECHLGTGTYNASSYNALIVAQHYSNGTNIKTGNSTSNISSCINCHENVSEMILYNNDTDYGSFTGDGIRLKGGNQSFYHYGADRSDLREGNSSNCSYCHKNASTAFASAMINASYNRSIGNHSNYSSNPGCASSQCHNTGWLHNSTLTKPDIDMPNSTFCLNCHGKNSTSGLINFTGAITSIKEKHNNSVNCTECHMDTAKDVHPVKYLQQDATYSTLNISTITCITCHQTTSVDSKLTHSPPKIPSPMHHSDNAANGTIWNSSAYWTPASPLTSCTYCHNDTKHNASALGRPSGWQGNNVVNSSLASGTWCSSCHYRNYASGSKNYSDMTLAFVSVNLSVPPEITNGSYAIKIFNRSNYYNHSLTDYSDSVCMLCHGPNLSSTSNISELMHNVTTVNTCTGCHYSFETMNSTTRPEIYVDFSMYNTSLHRSLSCTDCHTQGHKNIGARKACEDCHAVQEDPITDKDRHNITSTPTTYFVGASSVINITDCTTCHDPVLYNRSISTYGYWKSKDCDYCHTYPDKYYE